MPNLFWAADRLLISSAKFGSIDNAKLKQIIERLKSFFLAKAIPLPFYACAKRVTVFMTVCR